MALYCPGFFDLQVNGYAGVDFNGSDVTADDVRRAADALASDGVTRFLPALITSSRDEFSRRVATLVAAAHPGVAGIHMEGPYINPEDGPRGAHPRQHVTVPSIEDFQARQEAAGGRIALATLAPEVPGATQLIEFLVAAGVCVAIGHTNAAPAAIRDAIRAGATLCTHLGNGCAQMLPRHPNFIWEQLAADELVASLIADGHHLDPATVKAMIRAKSPERVVLVTDAMAAAACPPGLYKLGDLTVERTASGRVAAPGATHLAGSSLTMPEAVSNTVRFSGLPLDAVLPMATTRPAELIGMTTVGRLAVDWNEKSATLKVVATECDQEPS